MSAASTCRRLQAASLVRGRLKGRPKASAQVIYCDSFVSALMLSRTVRVCGELHCCTGMMRLCIRLCYRN